MERIWAMMQQLHTTSTAAKLVPPENPGRSYLCAAVTYGAWTIGIWSSHRRWQP